MKLIKNTCLLLAVSVLPVVHAAPVSTTVINSSSHYVVSPGTRLMQGDPKLNEFYILGARSIKEEPKTQVGVKARVVRKATPQKMKVALHQAFHSKHVHASKNKSHVAKIKSHHTHKKLLALHKKTHKHKTLAHG